MLPACSSLFYCPLLVIIDDFHIIAMAITPNKTDSPLIIDTNRVLPFPTASQCFQLISRRRSQNAKTLQRALRVCPIACGDKDVWLDDNLRRRATGIKYRRKLSRGGPKYKIKARSFGERSEVPVSREERNASVDTALGDQRVAEARLAALCQHLRSQPSCPLPIARSDLDQRYF